MGTARVASTNEADVDELLASVPPPPGNEPRGEAADEEGRSTFESLKATRRGSSIDTSIDVPARDHKSEMRPRAPSLPKRWGAIDAMEEPFRARAAWGELAEAYLQWLDRAKAPEERAEILRRIGRVLCEELEDPEQALDAFVEALLLEPTDEPTAIALEAIANALSSWANVVKAVDAGLRTKRDEVQELALLEHLVRWTKTYLGRPDVTETYLARIRAIDPSHSALHSRMASVYREQGAFEFQREELERALLSARSGEEQRLLRLRLAEIAELNFGDFAGAAKHYEASLLVDPRGAEALHGLERIYRMQRRFQDLVRVLEQLAEAAHDDEDRVNALLRLADIHERQFVKPQQAAMWLEKARELEPENDDVLGLLERCYAASRAWPDLVRTLEMRAKVAATAPAKVIPLKQAAEVLETKLENHEGAATTLRRIVELDSVNTEALTELARLAERAEDWKRAATYRARLADLATSPEAKARILTGIGDMLAPADRFPQLARQHYERAASVHPGGTAAWDALERDARGAGALDRVASYLEKRIEYTDSARLKAQLFVRLAETRAARGEKVAAAEAYEQAIAVDATNEAAAAHIFAHYIESKDWEKAQPLCELLVNAATRDGDADRTFDLLRKATRIATALGDEERALTAALAAYRWRPNRAAADEVIDVCHRARKEAGVAARTEAALEEIASIGDPTSAPALAKLGEIRAAHGAAETAMPLFMKALAIDPKDRVALAGVAAIAVDRQAWAHAAAFKQRLADATQEADARFTLLIEAGELWAHRAKDLRTAAVSFEEALTMRPRDQRLLHTLLWVYGETEAWDRLCEILRAIANVEANPIHRAKSLFTMALIQRDKIGHMARAAALFEESLDLDGSRLEAFEKIVRIHTEIRDWGALEKAYQRMLRRLPKSGSEELRHALWFQLGLVYRDRMADAERSLEAFRAAAEVKPDDDETRRVVCELFVIVDRIDNAVAATREAIAARPEEAALYGELATLFLRQRAHDRAFCALDAMAAAGGTLTPEQKAFTASYTTPPLKTARLRLPAPLRRKALHPALEATLTAIFACVMPAVIEARRAIVPPQWVSRTLGDSLRPGSVSATRILTSLQRGCDVLGVVRPALYPRKTSAPLSPSPAAPAMFVSLEACDAMSEPALAFVIGKKLSELQPELAARAIFPTVTELTALRETAVCLARGEPLPATPSTGAFHKALREAMTKDALDPLRVAVARATERGAALDVAEWLRLADASASRIALLLAGSVEAARRATAHDAHSPGDLSPRERLADLLMFAVSDTYTELRAALGVAVP